MKIVVDTNILFSFFWKNSITRKLLLSSGFELVSPEISLEELKKYSGEIIEKTNLNEEEFKEYFKELKSIVKFINRKEYSDFKGEGEKLAVDKADAEFFALSMKLNSFLWSNDSVLKQQNKIKVLSTEEIIDILF